MVPINILGKKYGRLTVIEYDKNSKGHSYWLCKCCCGKYKYARGSHLRAGVVSSCGCLSKEVSSRNLKKFANSNRHKGKNNHRWKGDAAQHSSIHTWLKRHCKKREKCDHCKSKKTLDFALKKGKKYGHDGKKYLHLCRGCHLRYDYTQERKNKIRATLNK